MKFQIQILTLVTLFISCSASEKEAPSFMKGSFQDDYGIEFEISDDLFFQKPSSRYHVLKWNMDQQYLLAQNDANNPYDINLFTRIDWMKFEDMEPYTWGFCISAYMETSLEAAEAVRLVDRTSPKTGCNGLPFSRMRLGNRV